MNGNKKKKKKKWRKKRNNEALNIDSFERIENNKYIYSCKKKSTWKKKKK